MGHLAVAAVRTIGHVGQDVAHGLAVWDHALCGPIIPLSTLVRVQQQHELLLDQLAFLLFIHCIHCGRGRVSCAITSSIIICSGSRSCNSC